MLASDIDEELDDTLAAELADAAQSEGEGPSARLPRSGTLAAGEFAWWLAHLCTAAATGRLWTASGSTERSFFLDSGRVVLASGNADEDRLGEFLVREGRLTAEARDRALAEARASGRRLGLVLIQHGRLAGSELLPSLRAHQEQVVAGAVAATEGVLGFDPGLAADRRRTRLLRHPAALVRQGLMSLASASAEPLWERIGGREGVLQFVPRDRDVLAAIGEGPEDGRVLALFDGGRANALVASACGWPEATFLALAATLRAFGLLLPAGSRAAAALGGGQRDRQLAGERLLARFGLARAGDYFEFLGLSPDASRRDVVRAVARVGQELARVEVDPELSAMLADERVLVRAVQAESARVLGDDDLRAAYRAAVGEDRQPEPPGAD